MKDVIINRINYVDLSLWLCKLPCSQHTPTYTADHAQTSLIPFEALSASGAQPPAEGASPRGQGRCSRTARVSSVCEGEHDRGKVPSHRRNNPRQKKAAPTEYYNTVPHWYPDIGRWPERDLGETGICGPGPNCEDRCLLEGVGATLVQATPRRRASSGAGG